MDAKMTSNQDNDNGGEDFSWNAVWKSAVVIHDKGWSFEVFLPYSAIRFSKDKVQDWGLNITRRRRKTEQQYTWNAIDPNMNGFSDPGRHLDRHYRHQTSVEVAVFTLFFGVRQPFSGQSGRSKKLDEPNFWRCLT